LKRFKKEKRSDGGTQKMNIAAAKATKEVCARNMQAVQRTVKADATSAMEGRR
jgi:hypothetical protein